MDNNYQNNPQQPKQTNGMAIAALVCGIVGVVGFYLMIVTVDLSLYKLFKNALALSIVGIVLGVKGMNVAKTTGAGKGLAIAGLVCGIVGAAFSLIGAICTICVCASVGSLGALADYANYGF